MPAVITASTNSFSPVDFHLDSGTGALMVRDPSLLRTITPCAPIRIEAASGSTLVAHSTDTLCLMSDDGLSVTLSDVLLVPGLAINLISVSRICQAGDKTVVFSGDLATIVDRHGSVVVRGVRHGKIYHLLVHPLTSPSRCVLLMPPSPFKTSTVISAI